MNLLKDKCKWYRKLLGGRWAKWNGMWEQEKVHGTTMDGKPLMYVHWQRGYRGINLSEGSPVWNWNQTLNYDNEYIEQREDYTK